MENYLAIQKNVLDLYVLKWNTMVIENNKLKSNLYGVTCVKRNLCLHKKKIQR